MILRHHAHTTPCFTSFYVAEALLLGEGPSFSKHTAVIAAFALLNELDDLLYSLHQDQGSEPFACAKMWWLAALINDEVEPGPS